MLERSYENWAVLTMWAVWLSWVVGVHATQCNRTPSNLNTPRTMGDNGFMIKVSGHSNTYIPGDMHTVTLKSYKERWAKKFKQFLLVVEPAQQPMNRYGAANAGSFQLQGDSLTMYSDDCPNAVTQTSPIPKKDIEVLWRAPPSGSGCVNFKVTVVGQNDQWYMDDGRLTKLMCENTPNVKPRENDKKCCPCSEAKYEVIFECLWSRQTHPKDFPSNKWLTYFSDLIGASHSSRYTMWEYGGCATEGLKQLAERGNTQALEWEMKMKSKEIRTIIKARGTRYMEFHSKSFAIFRVDKKNHLMSLVSKFAPSPDWIVGVSSLSLCDSECKWIENKTLNLFPVDVGTNSGLSYQAKPQPTIPQQRIHRITNSYPSDSMSPFFDPTGEPMKPIARVVVRRQRIYHRECPDRPMQPVVEIVDIDAFKWECEVSEWSPPTICSATCGVGVRLSTRHYLKPVEAKLIACRRSLSKIEKCYTGIPCSYPVDNEIIPPECAVTHWGEWTQCSKSCGKGVNIRKRNYIVPATKESCNVSTIANRVCHGKGKCEVNPEEDAAADVCQLPLEVGSCREYYQRWYFDIGEAQCIPFTYSGCDGNRNNFVAKEDCLRTCGYLMTGYTGTPLNQSYIMSQVRPVNCKVSEWSQWSPCSTTCGKGRHTRTRTITRSPKNGGRECPRKLLRKRKCKNPSCSLWQENRCI